ncbi:hypothetical protein NBRC116599_41300 [Aquicoccus sp. SU-CL01552]
MHIAGPNRTHLPVPPMATKLRQAPGCTIIINQARRAEHGVRRSKELRRNQFTAQIIATVAEASWAIGRESLDGNTGPIGQALDGFRLPEVQI